MASGNELVTLVDNTVQVQNLVYSFEITAEETSAGVTPVDCRYIPGDVRRYGAALDGVTDDSLALSNALASIQVGGKVNIPYGSIRLASLVSSSKSSILIDGNGLSVITTDGNGALSFSGNKIRIIGIEFQSSASSTSVDTALDFTTSSNMIIEDCVFGRVLLSFGVVGGSVVEDLTVTNCKFEGDYTNASGADTYNIFDVRGVQRIHITDNKFDVVNPERFFKLSATENTETTAVNTSKQVFITGNVITGSMDSGRQVIDTFVGTTEIIFSKNIINLTGTINSIFDGKPGAAADANPNASAVTDVKVNDNIINASGTVTQIVKIDGSWGQAWEGAVHHRASVSNNMITHGTASTTASIDVRGMEIAAVSDNEISKTGVSFARAIRIGNCQSSKVKGNLIDYGVIEVLDGLTSQSGGTYSKAPLRTIVSDNIIEDFVSQAGIICDSQTGMDSAIITNNYIRNGTDSGTITGPIRIDTSVITDLCMTGNTSDMAGTNKDDPAVSGSTITKYRDYDNSWNSITFTYDPASLADGAGITTQQTLNGAEYGASVEVAAPYDLQDVHAWGVVRSTDTIEVRLENETGGVVDLASGTWAVAYRRFS